MMKLRDLFIGLCCAGVLGACSKDDKRDDSILDMSYLTGKNWYYNAWLGDKYSFGQPDVLEVIRFEKGGILTSVDFGGRQEHTVGKWFSQNNRMTLVYDTKDSVVWNVIRSGDDYIHTIVNAQGERDYSTDAGYLDNLTADAFLVNEYTSENRFQTYIGAEVRGNVNVREAALITSAGKYKSLENRGYYWTEGTPAPGDYFDAKAREVYFYLRLGKDTQLKLRDSIYSRNLPGRTPAEVGLVAESIQGAGVLSVGWNSFTDGDTYYRVEVFPNNMDVMKPYFVSRVQPAYTSGLQVKPTTAGEVNRIQELRQGETYTVRLTVILYEPGVDVVNDEYSYANIQAVTYYTRRFVWE